MPEKNKTIKATIWSLLDTYVGYALKFIFTIIITRTLSPRDFGLVAYMGLFLGIARYLSDLGFGTALIQKKGTNEKDFYTAFWLNLSVNAFFFILYYVFASQIATFFKEPELKNIMRISSLNIFLNPFYYIHSIKLTKTIQYKKFAIVNSISSLISGLIGVSLAITGFNYWALIFQHLADTLIRMVGLWLAISWIPKFEFCWSSFKEQLKFGTKIFISGLLNTIFREIHSLVIGKFYQTYALGNYARGKRFYDLFIIQTGISFNKVLYPTMVQMSQADQKRMYFKTYGLLFFVMAPMSMFLILLSKPLVLVLLTDKWIDAVPFMQLYCIAGFISILSYFNSTTILSANRPNDYLILELIKNLFFAIALLITYKKGINGIVIGWLIASYIHFLFYEVLMNKSGFSDSYWKYLTMLQVLVCNIPSLILFLISKYYIENQFILLLLNAIFQPIIYLFSMRVSRFLIYKDFKKIVEPFFPKKLLVLGIMFFI